LFYLARKQEARAEEAARAGVDIFERLRMHGRLDHHWERYLGRAYCNLGLIVAGRSRSTEAESIYGQAADLLSSSLKENPDSFPIRHDLVITRMRQAALQVKVGQYRRAAEHYREVLTLDPKHADGNNAYAWMLATCPEPSVLDASRSVELARIAVDANSKSGAIWNTLGVAYFRMGDCQACIEALDKSMQLRAGGDSYDWFFLAMAYWKLGDQESAHRWLAKGTQWLEKNDVHNDELQRFQVEAMALVKH
jgi:tetratricopeptide (TPR) repeat protein